jgi:elongation factor G
MDYLKQERERGITITAAAITFGWRDHRVNLIDTPGHADFTIEVERSVRVLDGAIAILDGTAGVEAQTRTVWQQADRYGVPRVVYVNKMDRVGAAFGRTVREIAFKLGSRPLVCQIPVTRKESGNGPPFVGVVDLLTMEVLDWAEDARGTAVNRVPLDGAYPDAALYEEAIRGRTSLIETLSEMDDALLDAVLVTEDHMKILAEDVRQALRRVTIAGRAVPVLCGASLRNVGVQPLMDAVVDYLPSPLDRPSPIGVLSDGNEVEVKLDDKDRMCALAFKVIHDQKRGSMVFVRVYLGQCRQ